MPTPSCPSWPRPHMKMMLDVPPSCCSQTDTAFALHQVTGGGAAQPLLGGGPPQDSNVGGAVQLLQACRDFSMQTVLRSKAAMRCTATLEPQSSCCRHAGA